MSRVTRWALGLILAAALAASGPATAQQQQPQPQQQPQQDPFGGQFGVVEVARPPAEAVRDARLMGEALSNLRPQRRGRVDTYFIVASFWGEPVFESEATQAEAILREHFGADERNSIVLSAGGGAERRFPSATPDHLSAAIGQVGSLIDANEDLVVLFLTSHGSPDGSIALREPNRLSASMRPVHLRDMLQQAGIRNRVVIVSACFSGAFIAPLMDDNTIVLTAAAPNRSSFGCQPQREWTFFGDAYFNHALRGGASLINSFDQARVLIEQWEREQHLTPPSNPQRFIGPSAADLVRRAERAR
jgi:hypothetical protein